MTTIYSTSINQAWWEKMVADGCGFTQPWLDLDPQVVRDFAASTFEHPPAPLNELFPLSLFANLQGKDVLCLASGGGQQSAVFGLLGAHVTVVDIAAGQLAGDQQAAQHYGYQVTTMQADMSDLSQLSDQSFDLVYQPPSMAYVPNILPVYKEVARVLKPGGIYRADALNPLAQFIDDATWDGVGYRVSTPYSVKEKPRSKNAQVIEYRHSLSEAINGLIELGFTILQVVEAPSGLYQSGTPTPGVWPHSELYLPGILAIVAKKA